MMGKMGGCSHPSDKSIWWEFFRVPFSNNEGFRMSSGGISTWVVLGPLVRRGDGVGCHMSFWVENTDPFNQSMLGSVNSSRLRDVCIYVYIYIHISELDQSVGADDGLSPVQPQTIIWTQPDLL